MLNAEKEAWLEALESGKFIHGKKRLKTVDVGGLESHCCLGVLVEVMGVKLMPTELDRGDEHRGESETEFNRIEVDGQIFGYEWFEKITRLPSSQIATLYCLNDANNTEGFSKQAAWIRANVEAK